jgi:hypothetical protein
MNRAADAGLRAQLEPLAVSFGLPYRHPYTDDAIALACELLARDLDTPATVEVAALSYGTPLRDSEALIRTMLSEYDVPVLRPDATESERFDFIVRAFGNDGVGVNEFLPALYRRVPDWSEQAEAQRALVRLATDPEHQTTPDGKAQIIAAMREVARGHPGRCRS